MTPPPSTEAGSLRAAPKIEEAREGDTFVGWRVTFRGRSILCFNDEAMPGFRAGDAFVPSYGKSIEYRRAALSAASPLPEPAELSMSMFASREDYKAALGHQAEASSRGAVQRQDGDTEDASDAARYRFLKTQAYWDAERDMGPGGRWWLAVLVRKGNPTFDAAVDAAMKEQP